MICIHGNIMSLVHSSAARQGPFRTLSEYNSGLRCSFPSGGPSVISFSASIFPQCTFVGNKDHATVLHACKIVKDQVEVDKAFKADIEEIEASLKRKQNKTTEVRKGHFLYFPLRTSVLRLIVPGNSLLKTLFLQGFFQSYRHTFIIRLLVSDLSKYLSQCFLMIFFNKLMIFRK